VRKLVVSIFVVVAEDSHILSGGECRALDLIHVYTGNKRPSPSVPIRPHPSPSVPIRPQSVPIADKYKRPRIAAVRVSQYRQSESVCVKISIGLTSGKLCVLCSIIRLNCICIDKIVSTELDILYSIKASSDIILSCFIRYNKGSNCVRWTRGRLDHNFGPTTTDHIVATYS
jgi:hypothetical protein